MRRGTHVSDTITSLEEPRFFGRLQPPPVTSPDRPSRTNGQDGAVFCQLQDRGRFWNSRAVLRDCIQRDGRFLDGLGIYVESSHRFISVEADTASVVACLTLSLRRILPFLVFEVSLVENTGREPLEKLWVNFVAHIPREHAACLEVDTDPDAVKEIIHTMPNIQELVLMNIRFPEGFLQPAQDGPLPARNFSHHCDTCISTLTGPSLVSYLVHQTSGGQVISLRIAGGPLYICPHVVESIRNVVEELVLEKESVCWASVGEISSRRSASRRGNRCMYGGDESNNINCGSLFAGPE